MHRNSGGTAPSVRFTWSLRAKAFVVLAVLAVSSVIVVTRAAVVVPAGTKGVLLTWGEVTGRLDEGLHFRIPIAQQVVSMDITIQKAEASESTASADLQEVTTRIAVNYRLDPGSVDAVYQALRQDYEARVVNPNIEESIKATTALFQAEELVTKRAEVKAKFEQILTERLAPYHIEVLSVSITDFQFSDEFARAIEAKVTAEQKALEAKNTLEQIRYEAQQQVIQAEAKANATITTAIAEAEAIRIINEQLSDLYLQKAALDQWDGELPYVYSGDVLPFIQVPTNATTP